MPASDRFSFDDAPTDPWSSGSPTKVAPHPYPHSSFLDDDAVTLLTDYDEVTEQREESGIAVISHAPSTFRSPDTVRQPIRVLPPPSAQQASGELPPWKPVDSDAVPTPRTSLLPPASAHYVPPSALPRGRLRLDSIDQLPTIGVKSPAPPTVSTAAAGLRPDWPTVTVAMQPVLIPPAPVLIPPPPIAFAAPVALPGPTPHPAFDPAFGELDTETALPAIPRPPAVPQTLAPIARSEPPPAKARRGPAFNQTMLALGVGMVLGACVTLVTIAVKTRVGELAPASVRVDSTASAVLPTSKPNATDDPVLSVEQLPALEEAVASKPARVAPKVERIAASAKASHRATEAPKAAEPAPRPSAPVPEARSTGASTISITASEPANIVIDGRVLGKTPRTVNVQPGVHTVVVGGASGRHVQTVRVEPGQTQSIVEQF